MAMATTMKLNPSQALTGNDSNWGWCNLLRRKPDSEGYAVQDRSGDDRDYTGVVFGSAGLVGIWVIERPNVKLRGAPLLARPSPTQC